ncbi:MAG TPA: OmpH family outer membrane protein [Gemmatimonadales bacterium]|nr:OmpH family outer membrane protein [Gemmatimonadales bacterium]
MRRVVILWAWIGVGAAAPATLGAQATGGPKIAYIHSRTILEQTPGYAAADSTLRKEGTALQDTLQRMQQQWDSATRAFEQQSLALSSAARQAKQRDLQQMQQRLQQRQTDMQSRYQQREQELLQPIQARVLGIVQGIRAEGNYALIFDMDAPNNSILTADPSLEVTAKVIARLKQSQ